MALQVPTVLHINLVLCLLKHFLGMISDLGLTVLGKGARESCYLAYQVVEACLQEQRLIMKKMNLSLGIEEGRCGQ